ncbi:MAG: hypothetical protein KGH64_06005 [Candidatus Micrarchaeota archaeon]|nr:hypothetical protein [Candidatus Micrarchaeota archaeon]
MSLAIVRQLADPDRFEVTLALSKNELKALITMSQDGLSMAEKDKVVDATNVYSSLAHAVVKIFPTGV